MKNIFYTKLLVMLGLFYFTIYPVFELSRCIITYNIIDGLPIGALGSRMMDFYVELALIWVFYIAVFVFIWKGMGWIYRIGQHN